MSRISTLVPGLCVAVLVAGCEKPPPETKPLVRPVKIHTIGSLDPASIREYPGTIRAFQTAEMGFEVSGRVTDFFVLEGERVEKGAELAKIDPRDYAAQLAAAEAELRKARADLARSEGIFKEDPGAISKQKIDADRRGVDVAKAQLDIQNKGVEDTVLRAPFAGLMARKLVEDFANVQAKEPVLILQDMSVLEIEIDVPERDIARASGQGTVEDVTARVQPKVILSALEERSFDAWIKEFAARANPETRTFPVKLNFDRPDDANILPGMTARVRVIVNPERAWSVPVTAARADESGKAYVWKVDPESMTVTRVPVALGEVYGDRVQITEGVEENDKVAVSGVTQLREGTKVREYAQ
jgi:RND family efflux transporter MFP subunit